ncbi:MAG: hypothetical protein DWQ19_09065 [Crenarchaeota archaeon]|nr:MAG: hypothetical protein DWQ19_09065 [Thermoproteota archaeon]
MVTIEQARKAKETAKKQLKDLSPTVGIGYLDNDLCLKIKVDDPNDKNLPSSIDGVAVVYEKKYPVQKQ